MSIDDFRESVRAAIDSSITSFRTVDTHPGDFDVAALRRYAVNSPSAVVVCQGSRMSEMHGTNLYLILDMAVFLMVRGSSTQARDNASLALTYAVAQLVHQNRWGDALAGLPRNVEWRNANSEATDKAGIAIQAVLWEQGLQIEPATDFAALHDFEELFVTTTLSEFGDEDTPPHEALTTLETT